MKIVPRQSSLVCEFFSQEYEAFIATPTRVTVVMFAQSHTAVRLNLSNTDTNGAEVSF